MPAVRNITIDRARDITKMLARTWPDATCELDFQDPYQLLVATILAAQSTDKRINLVTPALFARFPDAAALARADQGELETLIHSTGFYRNKAKHLLGMARAVVERHGGQIPRTIEELMALPGVARKTANVVLGTAFGVGDGVVVDTHVTRLAARLGMTRATDPVQIERDLQDVLPVADRVSFAHRLIWHGRRVCHARKPDCGHCALAPLCPSADLPATAATPAHASPKAKGTPKPKPKPNPAPKAPPPRAKATKPRRAR